jgi:radical SAM superfamily enzyme YgiQ (UPF0313 family)
LDSALLKDGRNQDRDELILRSIMESKARIVGISSFIHDQNYVAELAGKIKSLDKSIFVMAGGPQPTVRPEYFLRCGVDLVVRGEAEYRICKIIDDLNNLEIPAYEKSNIPHYSQISSKVIRGVLLKVASIMTCEGVLSRAVIACGS